MNKKLVAAIIALAVIAGGFFLITNNIDTTPVTHTGCVVTDTKTHHRPIKQGGNKHFIETENCGTLRSDSTTQQAVKAGKTYDITMTGLFSWDKTATKAQELYVISNY